MYAVLGICTSNEDELLELTVSLITLVLSFNMFSVEGKELC